jgi:RHS repeat-associated protein
LILYLYDQGRRLTSKETKNLNTNNLINKYEYGYNKVHMKTYEQRLHDSGKGNVMAYDELYRLTNLKFNVPDPTLPNPTVFEKEKTVTLDHLHNILNIVENYNDQTKTITTDIPGNSDYSKLNQYASFDQWGLSYDKKGNTKQRGTQQLAYDYRNQLVTAVDAPSSTQVEMRYDVLGRRTQKSVTIGSQTKIENYYHSGHQVIEVRDGNDQVLRQYIYGNGIDEIIRMDKYEGDTYTSYYYHTDASGSVTAITDANGQLIERVAYDIYGMPTFWDAAGNKISKSSIGNNILFQGREYDYELNLYYFRARYYCPIMGRFLQTDPMGYQDSMNLYQGFNMNPLNFLDPWGLEKVIVAAFKAVGGPRQSQEAGRYDQTPTKAGEFIIGTKPFLYSNPNSRYPYSIIPWNTQIRVNRNKMVEFKIGNSWKTIENISEQDVQDDINFLLSSIKREHLYRNIPSSISFPNKWILNDYGHAAIAYYNDKNKNGVIDNGETLENDMIHPTPLGELQKALGIPNDEIYLEKSHGCIHVTPDDIDTMIARGYLAKGNKVIVHIYSEDIPQNWKYDPTGVAPFEIHFFPGKKRMVILGEK